MPEFLRRWQFAVLTWPSLSEWLVCIGVLCVYGALAFVINQRSGLFEVKPANLPASKLLALMFIAIITPSLLEESLYRAFLIPRFSEGLPFGSVLLWTAVSLFLYVVSHPLIAWLAWPWSRFMFYKASFLGIVTLLGLACSFVYLYTQSVWPAVLIHWFTIVIWKSFLGGPDFNFSKN